MLVPGQLVYFLPWPGPAGNWGESMAVCRAARARYDPMMWEGRSNRILRGEEDEGMEDAWGHPATALRLTIKDTSLCPPSALSKSTSTSPDSPEHTAIQALGWQDSQACTRASQVARWPGHHPPRKQGPPKTRYPQGQRPLKVITVRTFLSFKRVHRHQSEQILN